MGENLDVEGRLAVRTPMQWDAGPNGGFSDRPEAPPHPSAARPACRAGARQRRRPAPGPGLAVVVRPHADPPLPADAADRLVRRRGARPRRPGGARPRLPRCDDWRLLAVHNLGADDAIVTLELGPVAEGSVLRDVLDGREDQPLDPQRPGRGPRRRAPRAVAAGARPGGAGLRLTRGASGLARCSASARATGHAPSLVFDTTVHVMSVLRSWTLRNDTPASLPTRATTPSSARARTPARSGTSVDSMLRAVTMSSTTSAGTRAPRLQGAPERRDVGRRRVQTAVPGADDREVQDVGSRPVLPQVADGGVGGQLVRAQEGRGRHARRPAHALEDELLEGSAGHPPAPRGEHDVGAVVVRATSRPARTPGDPVEHPPGSPPSSSACAPARGARGR